MNRQQQFDNYINPAEQQWDLERVVRTFRGANSKNTPEERRKKARKMRHNATTASAHRTEYSCIFERFESDQQWRNNMIQQSHNEQSIREMDELAFTKAQIRERVWHFRGQPVLRQRNRGGAATTPTKYHPQFHKAMAQGPYGDFSKKAKARKAKARKAEARKAKEKTKAKATAKAESKVGRGGPEATPKQRSGTQEETPVLVQAKVISGVRKKSTSKISKKKQCRRQLRCHQSHQAKQFISLQIRKLLHHRQVHDLCHHRSSAEVWIAIGRGVIPI